MWVSWSTCELFGWESKGSDYYGNYFVNFPFVHKKQNEYFSKLVNGQKIKILTEGGKKNFFSIKTEFILTECWCGPQNRFFEAYSFVSEVPPKPAAAPVLSKAPFTICEDEPQPVQQPPTSVLCDLQSNSNKRLVWFCILLTSFSIRPNREN